MKYVQSAPGDERRDSRLLPGTIAGGVGGAGMMGGVDSNDIIPFNGYDRKALDITTEIPLLNTLGRLQFLTSTQAPVREQICGDGGLDRLLEIVDSKFESNSIPKAPTPFISFADADVFSTKNSWLSDSDSKDDGDLFKAPHLSPSVWEPVSDPAKKRIGWIWLLAFHCICNIGIRGSEYVRCRVVDAGALPIIVKILECFMKEATEKLAKEKASGSSSGRSHRHRSRSNNSGQSTQNEFEGSIRANLATVDERSNSPIDRIATPDASSDGDGSGQDGEEEDMVSMTSGSTALTDSTIATFSTGIVTRNRAGTLVLKTNRNRDVDHEGDIIMSESSSAPWDSVENSPVGCPYTSLPSSSSLLSSATVRPNQQSSRLSDSGNRNRQGMTSRLHFSEVEVSLAPEGARVPEMVEVEDLAAPLATMTAPSNSSSDDYKIRDEEILLCLQLLAYLSKYPNVRSIFHNPHADPLLPSTSKTDCSPNVFSVVEKFTFRSSRDDRSIPRLSTEIQYWASVIMRNACRKDESKGGIRQCANMECGVWEKSPREFAKCRRCRKAKYCSKTCQSKAWSQGHRYWCSSQPREDSSSGNNITPTGNDQHRSSRHHHHHHEEARDSDSMEDRTPPPPPPRQNPFLIDQQFLPPPIGANNPRFGDMNDHGVL